MVFLYQVRSHKIIFYIIIQKKNNKEVKVQILIPTIIIRNKCLAQWEMYFYHQQREVYQQTLFQVILKKRKICSNCFKWFWNKTIKLIHLKDVKLSLKLYDHNKKRLISQMSLMMNFAQKNRIKKQEKRQFTDRFSIK